MQRERGEERLEQKYRGDCHDAQKRPRQQDRRMRTRRVPRMRIHNRSLGNLLK